MQKEVDIWYAMQVSNIFLIKRVNNNYKKKITGIFIENQSFPKPIWGAWLVKLDAGLKWSVSFQFDYIRCKIRFLKTHLILWKLKTGLLKKKLSVPLKEGFYIDLCWMLTLHPVFHFCSSPSLLIISNSLIKKMEKKILLCRSQYCEVGASWAASHTQTRVTRSL